MWFIAQLTETLEGKISSNEYSNFIIALFANIGIMFLAFFGGSTLTTNLYILLPLLFAVEIFYIFLAKKVLERLSLKVFLIGEELRVLRHNYKYSIPVMKIRKIKLEHGNAGKSRPYRIDYLNEENDFESLSFYVARWNTEFEKFIDFVEETNPYAKIERYALPWE